MGRWNVTWTCEGLGWGFRGRGEGDGAGVISTCGDCMAGRRGMILGVGVRGGVVEEVL